MILLTDLGMQEMRLHDIILILSCIEKIYYKNLELKQYCEMMAAHT